jgi:hypothetical protein
MKLRIATFVIGFISAILCLSQKPAQTQQVVWSSIDGCAKDIGGNDNSAWVIGCAPSSVGYGNEIWTWGSNSTSGWNKVYGGASAIAVSSTGTPWVIDAFEKSWHL